MGVHVSNADRNRLRELAKKWHELAQMPVMQERKTLWSNLHGLKATRPMVLIETGYIADYVPEKMLQCVDPFLRKVEHYMLDKLIHAEEVGDDIVLEDYFRIGWQMEQPSFGIEIIQREAQQKGLAYVFDHVIREPEDMKKLVKREFKIDKEKTADLKQLIEEIFGDILSVRLGNYSFMDADGCFDWVGDFFFGLTWQLHRFIGLEEMMYWYYDYPEAMHAMMRYMTDDRLRMFKTLEKEKCLVSNSDNQMGGPCFYGYCDDMPYFDGTANLENCWAWCESQETINISPEMYREFILPYMKELCSHFGRIYYGCCETVHNRIDDIDKNIPNVRALSVSMWNDFPLLAEKMGSRYVYSRKPAPPPMSGSSVDWDAAREDILKTKNTAQNCRVEFLFRDLYDICGDRPRLAKWVQMVKNEYNM